jgi:hypothetical protein
MIAPRLVFAGLRRLPSDSLAVSAYTEARMGTAKLARLGSAVLIRCTVTVKGLPLASDGVTAKVSGRSRGLTNAPPCTR